MRIRPGVRVVKYAPFRSAPLSGLARESVRGEARQLPHVMILPQVSDDVPRYYHYHPVVNRTTAENREYNTLK